MIHLTLQYNKLLITASEFEKMPDSQTGLQHYLYRQNLRNIK